MSNCNLPAHGFTRNGKLHLEIMVISYSYFGIHAVEESGQVIELIQLLVGSIIPR